MYLLKIKHFKSQGTLYGTFEFRMPGLNVRMLTNHNYSELLGNKLVLLILNFYTSIDKLFQWGNSIFFFYIPT